MKYESIINDIIRLSSGYYKDDSITYNALKGVTRRSPIMDMRRLCMYFISYKWDETDETIGFMFNRDRVTVYHSIIALKSQKEVDIRFRRLCDEIDKYIDDRYFSGKDIPALKIRIVDNLGGKEQLIINSDSMSLDDFKSAMYEYRKDIDEIIFKVDKTKAEVHLKTGKVIYVDGRDKLHYIINDFIWR